MEMTQEKMMETSMQNMKGNSFFGEMPEMKMSAEDQMRSLFKNQICSLEEKLEIANANFGRAVRDNSMKWMDRNNLKMESFLFSALCFLLSAHNFLSSSVTFKR